MKSHTAMYCFRANRLVWNGNDNNVYDVEKPTKNDCKGPGIVVYSQTQRQQSHFGPISCAETGPCHRRLGLVIEEMVIKKDLI